MKSCCWTEAARGVSYAVVIQKEEQLFINNAFQFLDRPGFLMRLANSVGKPLEAVLEALPARQQKIIHKASQIALQKGLVMVTSSIVDTKSKPTFSQSEKKSRRLGHWHSLATFGVGAVGGFFGVMSLPLELPVTTAIMLRSIAAIAVEFGMDLNDPKVQLECLYILSLGAPYQKTNDDMGSAYWSSRLAFTKMSHEAAAFLAHTSGRDALRAIEKRSAPVLVKFLTTIAARFEVVVSEKLMAEALPVIGAIGGGMLNAAFTEYFSDTARFHFGLRALERRHGRAAVENYYHERMEIS